jgi:hypothetical protein
MLNKVLRVVSMLVVSAIALALVLTASPVAAQAAPGTAGAAVSAFTVAGQLTAEEAAGLTQMREEEKLARDVYQYLYQRWGLGIFSNIASSEQTHMNAIKTLLDRYQLADPAAGNPAGVFTNPELQALYNQLIAQGSQSLVSALQVGITIENLDISDLQEQLALTTKLDIKTVYQNLLKGSQNHLRSFTATLQRQAS